MSRKPRLCNTLKKMKFRDRIAAALYIAKGGARPRPGLPNHGLDNDLVPYPCPSGKHWHVKSVSKEPPP